MFSEVDVLSCRTSFLRVLKLQHFPEKVMFSGNDSVCFANSVLLIIEGSSTSTL